MAVTEWTNVRFLQMSTRNMQRRNCDNVGQRQ